MHHWQHRRNIKGRKWLTVRFLCSWSSEEKTEGQDGQEVSSSFIFCQHSAKTLKKSLLSELTKVNFSSFPLPGLLCLRRIFSVSRLQSGDQTQNIRVCFMRFNTKEKSCEKMTVANLLLAEVLAGNKFVQEVTEAHFLPLEQSCSTGRGLVPYIRGQQLYLLSRRLVSLYHSTSLLIWRLSEPFKPR